MSFYYNSSYEEQLNFVLNDKHKQKNKNKKINNNYQLSKKEIETNLLKLIPTKMSYKIFVTMLNIC